MPLLEQDRCRGQTAAHVPATLGRPQSNDDPYESSLAGVTILTQSPATLADCP
jgi:hypothetical protein